VSENASDTALTRKWRLEGTPYEFLEFTKDGRYILVERPKPNALAKTTTELNGVTTHIGSYWIDDTGIHLDGFGSCTGAQLSLEGARLSLVCNGTDFVANPCVGAMCSTVPNNYTAQLSRVWVLKSVSTGENDSSFASGYRGARNLTLMFTTNGTYLVFYNNPDGLQAASQAGVSEWDWVSAPTQFEYSWNNWQSPASKVEVKFLGDRALKLYEGGFYFWFDLLRPTLQKTLPALEAGRTLQATDLVQIPRLVANPDHCTFAWWLDGSQAGSGKSHTLTNADVGKTLGLGYDCGGGYADLAPADLEAGTILAAASSSSSSEQQSSSSSSSSSSSAPVYEKLDYNQGVSDYKNGQVYYVNCPKRMDWNSYLQFICERTNQSNVSGKATLDGPGGQQECVATQYSDCRVSCQENTIVTITGNDMKCRYGN
jgi:hypothetical protein